LIITKLKYIGQVKPSRKATLSIYRSKIKLVSGLERAKMTHKSEHYIGRELVILRTFWFCSINYLFS